LEPRTPSPINSSPATVAPISNTTAGEGPGLSGLRRYPTSIRGSGRGGEASNSTLTGRRASWAMARCGPIPAA